MKIYASFTLALLLTGSISMKAPPDTLWTKIFGGQNQGGCNNNPGDVGRVVEITDDQGYVISGWTNSYGLEDTDVWILNTDGQGNEIWSYTLTVNDNADEAVYDMKKTSDGGFILTGVADIDYCSGGHGGQWACGGKILLIRTNEFGDTLWTRKYDSGDMGWSWGNSVQETIEGGYVVVGRTDTEENGTDLWMSLTDNRGNQVWSHIYGHSGHDEGHSVRQTDDGGFIVTGVAQSPENDTQKLWLIRTNELGDTLWTHKYLEGEWSEGKSVLQTDDGGFVVAGTAESWNNSAKTRLLIPPYLTDYLQGSHTEKNTLLRKDELTNLSETDILSFFDGIPPDLKISNKTYREIEHYQSVLQQDKVIEERDAWLLRTNELGEKLWSEIIGGPGWDDIHSLSETIDGGYILCGEKWIEGHDSQDIWLIRTDSNGDTLWTTTLGDSSHEVAYDVKQTLDRGYIVSGMKHNRDDDVDQTWLIRYGEEITGLGSQPNQLATEFRLEQNYPNPFNPTTVIGYRLSAISDVELSIYNLLGQRIVTLVSETQRARHHQVEWDGTDQFGKKVSSGIYLYKLETTTDVQVRKMIVIK